MHHTKSLGTGTKEWGWQKYLVTSVGRERGNKSAITDDLFLKLQFTSYPLS